MASPTTLELDVDDHLVVADRLPGDGPAWIYLHGLTSTRVGQKSEALFRHCATRGRAAWRFDLRGHGASGGELGRVTVSDLIRDTRRVLAEAGPSVLVGSSLGGLVAAWTAATADADEARASIAALVLVAPALGFLSGIANAPIGTSGGTTFDTGDGRSFWIDADVVADARRYDERTLADRLRVPTLIVHGELDATVPLARSTALFDALPSTTRKAMWVVPGGDHALSAPFDQVLLRIEEFVESSA